LSRTQLHRVGLSINTALLNNRKQLGVGSGPVLLN